MSSSGGSSKGKGGNNRKPASVDPSPPKPVNPPLSLTEFPRNESVSDKSSSSYPDPSTEEPESKTATQEPEPRSASQEPKPNPSQWDDSLACQLEGILITNIEAIFRDAIEQLVGYGHTEEAAQRAINGMGFYLGGKDIVGNIVHDAMALLSSLEYVDNENDVIFENLNQLAEFTLAEMINVLAQVKPTLSTGEAMWWLLIVDMDLTKACEVEGEKLEDLIKEIPLLKGSSDSVLPEMSSKVNSSQPISQTDAKKSLPNPLELGNFPSSYPKKAPYSGTSDDVKRPLNESEAVSLKKLVQGFIDEKMAKSTSKSRRARTKGSTSKSKGKTEAPSNAPLAVSVSKDSSKSSASAAASTQVTVFEKKPPSKAEVSSTELSKAFDFYAGIPFDKTLGKHVPRDSKDEQILELVSRKKRLEEKVQRWNDWASRRVMEATSRLSRDRLELKALRQEKEEAEQVKKEIEKLKDNTTKRMSEIESAIVNANREVTEANDKFKKLEAEQDKLKEEMEAAKVRAAQAAVNCEEALAKEKKALKDVQSWKGQKSSLQEELESHKQEVVELQKELSEAEKISRQIQAKLNKVTEEKEEVLKQAASIRNEREKLEASAKAEEEMIKQNAEYQMQKYAEDIEMLEKEISKMKMKFESSNKADLGGETSANFAENFLETFGIKCVKRERECVMCLSEEAAVVFIPCAHQVLCKACNDIHERIGTINCPCCRAYIEKRITARFDRPCQENDGEGNQAS